MKEDLELFDRVQFESDRTCCVCRERGRPIQIHHIDGNHSNNERSNLAVVCGLCHDDIHAVRRFNRDFSDEQVRMYDESWRNICAARLLPETPARETEEYRQEVLLELNIISRHWKHEYLTRLSLDRDVLALLHADWDFLIQDCDRRCEDWETFGPLFDAPILETVSQLRNLLASHSDVIRPAMKTLMIRTIRQLSRERTMFAFNSMFDGTSARIKEVLRALATLSRAANPTISPVDRFRE